MNKQEEWKPVDNYSGTYEVSDLGRIRRVAGAHCLKTRILKPSIGTSGYLGVVLSKDGQTKNHMIHLLVARAFLGTPTNGEWVAHNDNVKTNCAVSNLCYLPPGQNTANAYRDGLMPPRNGENNPRAKLTTQQAMEIRRLAAEGVPRKAILPLFPISKTGLREILVGNSYKEVA